MTLDELLKAAEEQRRRGWEYLPVRCDKLIEAIKAERELHARQLNKLAEAAGGGSR